MDSEAICKRCGVCCHDKRGMPCAHLRTEGGGTTRCEIYGHHLGWRQTIDGRAIECVTIEREIADGGRPKGCAYLGEGVTGEWR